MLSIILVEPEKSENIGFIARAMKNFEVSELIILNPKELNEKAKYVAMHAKEIIENARVIFSDPKIALNDLKREFNLLIGTTGKYSHDKNMIRDVIECETFFREHMNYNAKNAIVLGRESIGLTNEELLLCDCVITIETSKNYSIMNVSHALSVILYVYYKYKKEKRSNAPKFKPLPRKEYEILIEKIDKIIDKIETNRPDRLDTMKKCWIRVLGKAKLTKAEGYVLMGFFEKIKRMLEKK